MVQEILFSDLINKTAEEFRDRPAISIDDKTLSYKELKEKTDKIATYLIKKGIKKGDRIALWGFNSIEWVLSFFAITKIGGIAILLNYSYTLEEIRRTIEFTDVEYLFFGLNRETRNNKQMVYAPETNLPVSKDKIYDISDFLTLSEKADNELLQERYKTLDCRDDALIIFTTGSSALPKAVRLSAYGMLNLANIQAITHKDHFGDNSCLVLPLFHCFGLTVMNSILLVGSRIVLASQIKTDLVLVDISKYKAKSVITVPTVLLELITKPDFDKEVRPYVNFIIMGGGVTTPEQYRLLCQRFDNPWISHGYGATECSPFITYNPSPDVPFEKKYETVGLPFPETQVEIQDTSSKELLPKGKIGEIIVKGYHLMNGYYKIPVEEQPIDADGWYHTGDLGFFDNENFLTLCGRIKDIIIKNGENISPLEIEKALTKISGISQAKCFGFPHEVTGEGIAACVLLEKDAVFNEEETKIELKKHISPFKIPSVFLIYDNFPLKENGKLDAVILKDDMLQKLGKKPVVKK